MKILQIDLNRSRDAHNAINWTIRANKVDIIIASEPNNSVVNNQSS